MSVVTGALGSLAPKLLHLLHDEYKLQKSVKKQVQWLSHELKSIYAFLNSVTDVPWDQLNEQVKVWAHEVREASYDMEDVLDTFLVLSDSSNSVDASRLMRAMNKLSEVFSKAKAHHGIAGDIEDIKKKIEEIAERRQRYKLDDIMSSTVTTASSIDPRLTAMYKEVTQLTGIHEPMGELISMLMPSDLDHDASNKKITKKVSIVGFGGLGKTTLAKAVYEKLRSQYDCTAFVSVGRDLDFVKIFKDILFDLDKYKYQSIHNDGRGDVLLIREVREFLEKKRYFIVVDDVWEVKTLDRIKLALVENNCGSRVITTTRKFDVATEASEVYKLKRLSYDNSKKLFYTRIFDAYENFHDNQPDDDVSDKILKKCDGVPLAIIMMSSLFVGKTKGEWSEVYKSIGFGHSKHNRVVENTMMILSFSYYDLPSHLRTCLLYLSTYPEDYIINKDSLIRKWIAEGFVSGEQGTQLFDIGERYFIDLVNRSMIQAEANLASWVFACRVHDMVLDLMRKFSFEENFIALLDDNVERTCSPSNARRLAQQNTTAEHIDYKAMVVDKPNKVRSYTALNCIINSMAQFLSFKLLRVLDIVDCSFMDGCHLDQLGNLQHLRYLGLKGNHKSSLELPKQIGDLKLLQTLDVDGHINGGLPASIVALTKLVCLCATRTNVQDGIGKLTSLEVLRIRNFNMPAERFVKELGSLRELRVLEFCTSDVMGEIMQIDFVESLGNLKKIQHIKVQGRISDVDATIWEVAGLYAPAIYPLFFYGHSLLQAAIMH